MASSSSKGPGEPGDSFHFGVADDVKAAADAAGDSLDDVKLKINQLNNDIKSFQDNLQKSFSSGITAAIKSGGDFSSLIDKVTGSIEDFVIQLAVVNPLMNSLFGGSRTGLGDFAPAGGGSGGGLFGSVLGGLTDLLEGRAGGGPVSAGTPYIVGEKGPELFVPQVAGRINNSAGGGAVNIVMNISASDAGSFRSSQAQIAAQMMDAVRKAQRIR